MRFLESQGGEEAHPHCDLVSALYDAAPLLSVFPQSLYQELANNGLTDRMSHLPRPGAEEAWFRLLDANPARTLRLEAHQAGNVVCRFTRDGIWLWTAAGDHRIRRWNMKTLREEQPPIDIRSPVWRLACHPTQPWVGAIAGLEGTLRALVFDSRSAALLFSFPERPEPLGSEMQVRSSRRRSLHVFDGVFEGKKDRSFPGLEDESVSGFERRGAIVFNHSGDELLVSLGESLIRRISTETWGVIAETRTAGQVSCVTQAPDGQFHWGQLSPNGATQCVAFSDGRLVWGDGSGSVWLEGAQVVKPGNSAVVGCAAIGNEGVLIALENGTLQRIRLSNGSVTALAKFTKRITSMDYSPASNMIAVALADGSVELMPADGPRQEAGKRITRTALAPDGVTIAEVESSHVEVRHKQEIIHLNQAGDQITACRFRGAKQIITGTAAGWVRIWDAFTGSIQNERRFPAMIYWIDCAVRTGDVAVISEGGRLDLWNPEGGSLQHLLLNVRRAVFSPDESLLAFIPIDQNFGILTRESKWRPQPVYYYPHSLDFIAVDAASSVLVAGTRHGRLFQIELPFEKPLSQLPEAAKGGLDLGIMKGAVVTLGETCQIRRGDWIGGMLRVPGVCSVDMALDSLTILVKQPHWPPRRYRLEGL